MTPSAGSVIDRIGVTAVRHMLFDAVIRLLHGDLSTVMGGASLILCIDAPIRPA